MQKTRLLKCALSIVTVIAILLSFGITNFSAQQNSKALSPAPYEDFESALGNGIGAANGTKANIFYGYETENDRISLAISDDDATKNYVINGKKSILLKHDGGDIGSFGIGYDSNLTFSPNYMYKVSFLMKAPSIPSDFRLMLQIMSWEGGNWGDEAYIVNDQNGGLTVSHTVASPVLTSMAVPTASVEKQDNDLYKISFCFTGADVKNSSGNYSSFFRLRFLGATASTVSVDDIYVEKTPVADAAIFTEDIENAIGSGIGTANGTKLYLVYGGEDSDGKISVANANDASTNDYVINGNKSLIIKHLGGDQSTFSLGDDANIRFSPKYHYTVKFLIKTPNLPNDFNLMLQIMSWNGSNWGNEMYIKSDGNGNLIAGNTVQNTGLETLYAPSVSVESKGNNVYEVSASFNGANVKNASNLYSSFFRLRPMGGTASTFSVDDFRVYGIDVGNYAIYSEGFELSTGFDNYGVITGSNGICFPYGSGTNVYHEIASGDNKVVDGNKSLVINKTGEDVHSFSFGNSDSAIRFDSEKRYVFTYDLKANGTLPNDFRVQMQLMSWVEPNWSNSVNFTLDENGLLNAAVDYAGAVLEGKAKKISDDTYRIAVAFNGMTNKDANDKFASFMRAVFYGTAGYSVSVDNFNVYISEKDLDDYLPVRAGDINDDQIINSNDLSALRYNLLHNIKSDVMDVKCDGEIDIRDLLTLKSIMK